jgi:hypothetical protein
MFTRMPQNTTAPLLAEGADKTLANPIQKWTDKVVIK